MPAKKPLTPERARELFDYEPETGILRRKIAYGKAKIGVAAGHIGGLGYLYVSADCYPYLVHRIAWAIMTGEWPDQIDHADMNRTNNKWSNLRPATTSQNMANRPAHRDSSSGRKGVFFHPQTQKWRARIYYNGTHFNLGLFSEIDDAASAYENAARQFHGEFARV